MPQSDDLNLLRGTLDLLILKAVAHGPRHGYGVVRWIAEQTEDELQIEDGALYTALHRLERRGLLSSKWGMSAAQRRAKFYTMTAKGRRQLEKSESTWNRYAAAVSNVLTAKPE
ncbi:MAG: PadR family transcriptional regulator [Gemmatimonadetes bacterium]|nr:PadR family transcriptional regulator [Gemmatimonadota bacterium]